MLGSLTPTWKANSDSSTVISTVLSTDHHWHHSNVFLAIFHWLSKGTDGQKKVNIALNVHTARNVWLYGCQLFSQIYLAWKSTHSIQWDIFYYPYTLGSTTPWWLVNRNLVKCKPSAANSFHISQSQFVNSRLFKWFWNLKSSYSKDCISILQND